MSPIKRLGTMKSYAFTPLNFPCATLLASSGELPKVAGEDRLEMLCLHSELVREMRNSDERKPRR